MTASTRSSGNFCQNSSKISSGLAFSVDLLRLRSFLDFLEGGGLQESKLLQLLDFPPAITAPQYSLEISSMSRKHHLFRGKQQAIVSLFLILFKHIKKKQIIASQHYKSCKAIQLGMNKSRQLKQTDRNPMIGWLSKYHPCWTSSSKAHLLPLMNYAWDVLTGLIPWKQPPVFLHENMSNFKILGKPNQSLHGPIKQRKTWRQKQDLVFVLWCSTDWTPPNIIPIIRSKVVFSIYHQNYPFTHPDLNISHGYGKCCRSKFRYQGTTLWLTSLHCKC